VGSPFEVEVANQPVDDEVGRNRAEKESNELGEKVLEPACRIAIPQRPNPADSAGNRQGEQRCY
jgi:hypothetical protein